MTALSFSFILYNISKLTPFSVVARIKFTNRHKTASHSVKHINSIHGNLKVALDVCGFNNVQVIILSNVNCFVEQEELDKPN